ncbi:MAG: hypothetical protein KDA74_15380, partial [Planctomycetaceae bacterium]|nr:hypothetical protein [Planctomycetaceae bacterium]
MLLTAFTVVNTNDSGEGSLRDAIEAANANAGADTISFDASLRGRTIVLSDELLISDDLTITGLGAGLLTLDGNGDSRIFNIDDGDVETTIEVSLSGLTLTHGSADYGGAIYSNESLSIVESTITANKARIQGGGITTTGGKLFVNGSRITANNSYDAGGIYSSSSIVTLTATTLSHNEAIRFGGAILSFNSKLIVSYSNFTSNNATYGGGIYSNSNSLTVTTSTFSKNVLWDYGDIRQTGGHGGGLYIINSLGLSIGPTTISDSSFFENSASCGGGILSSTVDLIVSNTDFSRNKAIDGGSGAGINAFNSILIVTASTFSENVSDGSGGGIFVTYT